MSSPSKMANLLTGSKFDHKQKVNNKSGEIEHSYTCVEAIEKSAFIWGTYTCIEWNRRWQTDPIQLPYKSNVKDLSCFPAIPFLQNTDVDLLKRYMKMRLDHTRLPAHKARYSTETSPYCEVCNEPFDVHHFFFQCIKFNSYRSKLLYGVNQALQEINHPDLNNDKNILLSLKNDIPERTRTKILQLTMQFMSSVITTNI